MSKEPDPFEYIANKQTYTASATCSKCSTEYSWESSTSQSAAQTVATGKAHACERKHLTE